MAVLRGTYQAGRNKLGPRGAWGIVKACCTEHELPQAYIHKYHDVRQDILRRDGAYARTRYRNAGNKSG
jgi:hypothetical protein